MFRVHLYVFKKCIKLHNHHIYRYLIFRHAVEAQLGTQTLKILTSPLQSTLIAMAIPKLAMHL